MQTDNAIQMARQFKVSAKPRLSLTVGSADTSTNGSGGHGFVPPKPVRVQDADITRLSRTGMRPDVTMPIQNNTLAP